MSKLSESSIYDLLPQNLQDAQAKALSAAFDAEFRPLVKYIQKTLIYANIMALDENVCDLLAMIFQVSAYKQSFDISTKRSLIRIALTSTSQKGTKTAVQDIISAIHGNAIVKEWFEYGGNPFHFKVDVDISQTGVTAGTYEDITKNVALYKNVRSKMESATYQIKRTGNIKTGMHHTIGIIMLIRPYVAGSIESNSTAVTGGVLLYSHSITVNSPGRNE